MLTKLLSLYLVAAMTGGPSYAGPNVGLNQKVQLASLGFSNLVEAPNKPTKDPLMIAPIIQAKGVIAIDMETGEVLYEKNPHGEMPIASITKLMTMLLILEENKLDETVTVSHNAANTEGSTMFLREGEKISVQNLLYGALISSANDAAVALAEHNADNVDKFLEKMNKRAEELKLNNTHFSSPMGLDKANNYSSAYDIAKLGSYIYKNKFIQDSATIKNLEVKSTDGTYVHPLETTNELLGSYLNIKGLKTGKTDAAGLCLVAIAQNSEGHEIITVVLNSPARFEESKILIDWVFRAYKWPST